MYLAKYIILSVTIFMVSFFGIIFNRKSIIIVLISIELLLLAVNILFAAFSVYLDSVDGFIFSMFILVIASAETCIGLSLLVNYSIEVGDNNTGVFNLLYA